jgi:hypothetical protein
MRQSHRTRDDDSPETLENDLPRSFNGMTTCYASCCDKERDKVQEERCSDDLTGTPQSYAAIARLLDSSSTNKTIDAQDSRSTGSKVGLRHRHLDISWDIDITDSHELAVTARL